MNVFVLSTGRCGSVTFSRACRHMTNYSIGHESRWSKYNRDRMAYPPNHIEVDNRLSWYLGRLERAFGDRAMYVHLKRDRELVADSFLRRWNAGILRAYVNGIVHADPARSIAEQRALCLDLIDTVNANIIAFLKDKSHTMTFHVERAWNEFPAFWQWIGAQGDLKAGRREWKRCYNAGHAVQTPSLPRRASRKIAFMMHKLASAIE